MSGRAEMNGEGVVMISRPTFGRRQVVVGLGLTGAALVAGPPQASAGAPALPSPKGPVILTISGKITAYNTGNKAEFDMASLEAMPQAGFATKTPWTPLTTFTGVLFTTLMERIGCQGKMAVTYPLNDYVVEIPLKGMSDDGPLLATKMDGKYMPVAHYGPLFVMYNFAKHPEWLQNDMYARCIWQLQRIIIT